MWWRKGIREALDEVQVKVPIVVRLSGTNAEEGKVILAEAGLTAVDTMDEAAASVVAAAGGAKPSAADAAGIEGANSVSILVGQDTRLLVQGITGREGSFHTTQMVEYGTNVVAGVTPGKKGEQVAGVPVFDTVADAVAETGANTSIIYVPARFAPDAIYEAVDSGIEFVICITEGVPVNDMVPVYPSREGQRCPVDRPQLPRTDHSRSGQGRASCRASSTSRGR